jgi:hypothetical protein
VAEVVAVFAEQYQPVNAVAAELLHHRGDGPQKGRHLTDLQLSLHALAGSSVCQDLDRFAWREARALR